jgi:TfoX/Sxy family transcriptional regulator of competence genes
MATSKDFVVYLQDCLRHVRSLRFKSMFGEYAMYADDVVVALVCDQTVFIKASEGTNALLAQQVKMGFPFPGAKPAYMLTEGELEDEDLMTQVIAAVLRDRVAKARKKKPATVATTVKAAKRSKASKVAKASKASKPTKRSKPAKKKAARRNV